MPFVAVRSFTAPLSSMSDDKNVKNDSTLLANMLSVSVFAKSRYKINVNVF